MYWIIKWWAFIFLRLYFRKTIVYGLEKVPPKGPLIIASNHPSAFLEASILATNLRRPVHFLVRGDMFHPRFRWLFNWTNQIPIYRQKDGIANLRKNASSFDLTYKKLGEGASVLIFPEAKTVLEKKMRPIQRGTAHLAFGTLPYLKGEEKLVVIPVGVNFTEPRLPGTDVVVRFGEPFVTQNGTREDRDAIEEFTFVLSESMSPLIIQIEEDDAERQYETMASIYYRFLISDHPEGKTFQDLVRISTVVNNPDVNKSLIELAMELNEILNKENIREANYFPELLVKNKVELTVIYLFKLTWWIAGGWIWRLVRQVIFKKIKTPTFQGPTSVGVAMVVFPLVSILFFLTCLIAGWPVYFVLIWMVVMALGTIVRPPLYLIWRILTLGNRIQTKLKAEVTDIRVRLKIFLG